MELLSEPPIGSTSLAIGVDLLSKRLGFDSNRQVLRNKRRYKSEPPKFCAWTQKKDPDGIGWIINSDEQYSPEEGLLSSSLDKLRNWIDSTSEWNKPREPRHFLASNIEANQD